MPYLANQAKTPSISWIPLPSFHYIYYVLEVFSGNEIILYLFVFICVIVLLKDKLYKNDKNSKGNESSYSLFLLMWLFLPIIISFIISYIFRPIFWDRYLIPSLPSIVLLASFSIKEFRNIIPIKIIIIILLLVTTPLLYSYYQNPPKEQWRDAASYISQEKKAGEIILFYTNYGTPGFEYYYKNVSDSYVIDGVYEVDNDTILPLSSLDGIEEHNIWFVAESRNKDNLRDSKLVQDELSKSPIDIRKHNIWLVTSELWIEKNLRESQVIQDELSKAYIQKDKKDFNFMSVTYYKSKILNSR